MTRVAAIDCGTNSIRLGVVQPDEDQTYQLLAQQKEVPADATVLIIAGPTSDFLAPEIEAATFWRACTVLWPEPVWLTSTW